MVESTFSVVWGKWYFAINPVLHRTSHVLILSFITSAVRNHVSVTDIYQELAVFDMEPVLAVMVRCADAQMQLRGIARARES